MEKVAAICTLGIIAIIIYALIVVGSREQSEWETFSRQHSCRIIARKQSETSTGWVFGGNGGGAVMQSTPEQTGYLCDDGVTYWR